jgi:hypothetical protein
MGAGTALGTSATSTPQALNSTAQGVTSTNTLGTGATSNPFAGSASPYIQAAQQNTLGNLAGAQAATAANRINQSTPYANLQYQQTGTDVNGNPIWSANQTLAQPLQNTLGNIQQNVQAATANPVNANQYMAGQVGQGPQGLQIGNAQQATGAGQAQQAYGINSAEQAQRMGNAANLQTQVQGTGMEGWDKATNLLMSRLQPQISQQNEQLDSRLANQGIMPGSEAYNRAKTQMAQQQNDLLTQAQLAGSQVQNTMFGQNLQAGQFGNQALTQQNASQLANTGLNNQAIAQNFGQNLSAQQLQNQAAQQNYTNQLAGTQLGNQAAQQNYANQLAGLNFNANQNQQGFANQLAGTQINNAAQQQNFANQLSASNNPLNQLNAFQQGTTPGYVNPYSQAAVAGPDYLGAYTTSRAADIAQQNANAAQQANLQSGLFGLGSSAILGAGGVGNLGNSVLSGANAGLSGLANLFGNNGLNNPFVSSADYMKNIGAYGSGTFDPTMSTSDYLNNLYGDLEIF